MRHKIKRLVEKEFCISECDFCNYKTETTRFTTKVCYICNRDMCRDHTTYHDHPFFDIYITTCPVCSTIMKKAWDWALEHAGINDDIRQVAIKRFHKLKEKLEQT